MVTAIAGPSRFATPIDRDGVVSDEEERISTLIAQLTLEEIATFKERTVSKGKFRDDVGETDADLALRIFTEDLESVMLLESDRNLAIQLDEELEFEVEPPRRQSLQIERPVSTAKLVRRHSSDNVSPLPSVHVAPPPPVHCVICLEDIQGLRFVAPCGDSYDLGCITDLFTAATRDESLFPPRCCGQTIPIRDVEQHLSRQLLQTLTDKAIEISTPNRVYCAQKSCGRFLGAATFAIKGKGKAKDLFKSTPIFTCPSCNAKTCQTCKALCASKLKHKCRGSLDESDEQVIRMGKEEGWSQCPGCNRMIELNMGCYHMTCLCKQQFCYLCRTPWKNCDCVLWDTDRLVARAEQRLQRRLSVRERVPPRERPLPQIRHVVRDRDREWQIDNVPLVALHQDVEDNNGIQPVANRGPPLVWILPVEGTRRGAVQRRPHVRRIPSPSSPGLSGLSRPTAQAQAQAQAQKSHHIPPRHAPSPGLSGPSRLIAQAQTRASPHIPLSLRPAQRPSARPLQQPDTKHEIHTVASGKASDGFRAGIPVGSYRASISGPTVASGSSPAFAGGPSSATTLRFPVNSEKELPAPPIQVDNHHKHYSLPPLRFSTFDDGEDMSLEDTFKTLPLFHGTGKTKKPSTASEKEEVKKKDEEEETNDTEFSTAQQSFDSSVIPHIPDSDHDFDRLVLDLSNISPNISEEMILEAMENIRQTHNCIHRQWTITYEAECEMCDEGTVVWHYKCDQCSMIVCNRCLRNRI
ncbi:hypothetical protein C8J56DRAFT_949154 [Mycena floridula]|nr:hypothetical protein C8J56DRAFT_949154 [Mycena floridula]